MKTKTSSVEPKALVNPKLLDWLDNLIRDTADYLLRNQELDGDFRGAIWSRQAFHFPTFDFNAGGSYHNRTIGPAGYCFTELANLTGEKKFLKAAELAFDWVCTRQDSDGAIDEIVNNNQASRWHGTAREGSVIELGLVVHGLSKALSSHLHFKNEYRVFMQKAAMWNLKMEIPPQTGNFLHSEGYPHDKLILNANAHSAETLLSVSNLFAKHGYPSDPDWTAAALRAIDAILSLQLENGMYPYSSRPDDHTIHYTAVVVWCLQNIQHLCPIEYQNKIELSVQNAMAFLEAVVDDRKGIKWDPFETHGHKFRTYTLVLICHLLMNQSSSPSNDKGLKILDYLQNKLYDPDEKLLQLMDIPEGVTVNLLGKPVRGEKIFHMAYNQADILEFLISIRRRLS